jgi:methyl acetate hydrolase
MKRSLWVVPLFIAPASAGPSFPRQAAVSLSSFLESAIDRGDVPGVVVTVVKKEGTLYNEAFGLSSTLGRKPMAKDTIFSIASMTKPVTSVAIMILVDEGKLTLDDDVAKYLPKYKDPVVISTFNEVDGSYETRPAKRPITIRHLLTHTSGFGYGFSSAMMTKIMAKDGKTELDLPLLFDPGESWAYGPSTRVLGQVVEAISGQKLDAFLAVHSVRPVIDCAKAISKTPRDQPFDLP